MGNITPTTTFEVPERELCRCGCLSDPDSERAQSHRVAHRGFADWLDEMPHPVTVFTPPLLSRLLDLRYQEKHADLVCHRAEHVGMPAHGVMH